MKKFLLVALTLTVISISQAQVKVHNLPAHSSTIAGLGEVIPIDDGSVLHKITIAQLRAAMASDSGGYAITPQQLAFGNADGSGITSTAALYYNNLRATLNYMDDNLGAGFTLNANTKTLILTDANGVVLAVLDSTHQIYAIGEGNAGIASGYGGGQIALTEAPGEVHINLLANLITIADTAQVAILELYTDAGKARVRMGAQGLLTTETITLINGTGNDSISFDYTRRQAGAVLTDNGSHSAAFVMPGIFVGTVYDSVAVISGTTNLTPYYSNQIMAAGSITSVTVTLPATPVDGEIFGISFNQAVSSLTWSGGVVESGVTLGSIARYTALTYKYDAARNIWNVIA